jgi:hypothetical protein
MLVKKLAVPFINDKLLAQAEHCYIATAGISETAFDFVRSRLSPKCKIQMVTGLDSITSPNVLKRIWRNYQDRITLNIYTRNIFHSNVYIFDLPFRKSVAFIGSGNFTMEGIKDHEEIFYRTTDPKEIEALMSWFTGYYEFAEPLNENMILEYDLLYPQLKQREIASRKEKQKFIELTSRAFNWDSIKFKTQYFKKEDYLVFSSNKIFLDTPVLEAERETVKQKFLQLHESLKDHLQRLKLFPDGEGERSVSSIHPAELVDRKLQDISLTYGRSSAELKKYSSQASPKDFMQLEFTIKQKDFVVGLYPGKINSGKIDREHLLRKMEEATYRSNFLKLLISLGEGYTIEVAGERKPVQSFLSEDSLAEFIKADDWRYYAFEIEKNLVPGSAELNNDALVPFLIKESEKLTLLYKHLRDPTFEKR